MRQGRMILVAKHPNMLAGIRRLLEDEAETVLMVTDEISLNHAFNPAGQSILKSHFGNNVSPVGLFKAALIPTLIMLMCFAVFR